MTIRLSLPVAMAAMTCAPTFAEPPATSAEPLLETDQTILGEAFAYPAGRARIAA
jgi:hypothetical protein